MLNLRENTLNKGSKWQVASNQGPQILVVWHLAFSVANAPRLDLYYERHDRNPSLLLRIVVESQGVVTSSQRLCVWGRKSHTWGGKGIDIKISPRQFFFWLTSVFARNMAIKRASSGGLRKSLQLIKFFYTASNQTHTVSLWELRDAPSLQSLTNSQSPLSLTYLHWRPPYVTVTRR